MVVRAVAPLGGSLRGIAARAMFNQPRAAAASGGGGDSALARGTRVGAWPVRPGGAMVTPAAVFPGLAARRRHSECVSEPAPPLQAGMASLWDEEEEDEDDSGKPGQKTRKRAARSTSDRPVAIEDPDSGPQKLYIWKNGRRVEVTNEKLLSAEQDKKLWERAEELRQALDKVKPEVVARPPKERDELVMAEMQPSADVQQDSSRGGWGGGAQYPADQMSEDIKSGGLSIKKADFTVNSLMDKIRRKKLNLRPSYQREYVWDHKTASKLIESLLLNMPIPTLFFHEVRTGVLEVVDGKQRLTTIWSFIQNEFPDLEPFRLSGLTVYEELNGASFTDLTEEQQETIKDYAVNVHTIMNQSQPEFVFEVFERLNMGSTQLNEQELRNCIYQGSYTNLLQKMVQNEHMLAILKSDKPHMRMKDRELVLRFFAMRRATPHNFSVPVKAWLNTEIREFKHASDQELDEMAAVFERTIKLAWDVFGEAAFRPIKAGSANMQGLDRFETGEVNVTLWDTVMYSLWDKDPKLVLAKKEQVVDAYVSLMENPTFRKLMVSQAKAVVARYEAWDALLTDTLKKK